MTTPYYCSLCGAKTGTSLEGECQHMKETKNMEKKISIGELLTWFKRYERFVEADNIDAVEWRKDFMDFIMYLVNNLDEK